MKNYITDDSLLNELTPAALKRLNTSIFMTKLVTRSNEKLHQALKELVIWCAPTKNRKANWLSLTGYVQSLEDFDAKRDDQSMTTASILEWINQVVKVDVSKEGVVTPRDDVEYKGAWAADVRRITWYKIGRGMQVFKIPAFESALTAFARQIAKAQAAGFKIDVNEISSKVDAELKSVVKSKGHEKWLATAIQKASEKGVELNQLYTTIQ